MSKNLPEPLAEIERDMVERVTQTAHAVIDVARGELDKARLAHKIGDQLLALQTQEQRDHREMTPAWALLNDALGQINSAEQIFRSRGETNGR